MGSESIETVQKYFEAMECASNVIEKIVSNTRLMDNLENFQWSLRSMKNQLSICDGSSNDEYKSMCKNQAAAPVVTAFKALNGIILLVSFTISLIFNTIYSSNAFFSIDRETPS